MGYDMYVVTKDPAVEIAKQAASERFHAAVKARDAVPDEERFAGLNIPKFDNPFGRQDWLEQNEPLQKAVSEAYEEMYRVDTNYYRLNIWGMSLMRDLMAKFGMLQPDVDTTWPDGSDFGLTDEDEEAISELDLPEDNDKLSENQRKYLAAMDAHRSATGEGGGIPANKFGSNDGWIVTPDEIAQAVAAYRGQADADATFLEFVQANPDSFGDEPDDLAKAKHCREWFERWIGWLEIAATRDGFRVY